VSVIGISKDAGAIDVTEDVDIELSGHPTFGSITREANALISDFYKALK
jgi:hypothetical protein